MANERKRRSETDLISGFAFGVFVSICADVAISVSCLMRGRQYAIIGDVIMGALAVITWLGLRKQNRDIADGLIVGAAITLIGTHSCVAGFTSPDWHP